MHDNVVEMGKHGCGRRARRLAGSGDAELLNPILHGYLLVAEVGDRAVRGGKGHAQHRRGGGVNEALGDV